MAYPITTTHYPAQPKATFQAASRYAPGYRRGGFRGLDGVNCIYDDATVVSMDQGPCQETLDSGAYLVDANISETEITVYPEPESFWGWWALGIAVVLGGLYVSRR